MTTIINGEPVDMTEEERAELGLMPTEQQAASSGPLTIRVFRTRFETSESDLVLYDELSSRMEVERSRLVRQQWADPGAEIIEDAALHTAISRHLDELVTPERKAELLARP